MSSLVAGESLRILLVSTQRDIQEDVEQALAGLPGDPRLYWVAHPDLALTRATDLVPHVIIVDDALGDVDPADLISELAAKLRTSALLILVEGDGLETSRRAILQGARGFVTKPIVAGELQETLRRVLARREAPVGPPGASSASGHVVVFCGPKGGTGRTTLAVNTAISLGRLADDPVVLVDADYAAPAIDVALNLPRRHDISDLSSRLAQLDAPLIASILASYKSGLKVLLAPPPATLDALPSLPHVQQVVAWLKKMFPWVIVDLGLPLDATAYAFLDGADLICMSVNPEMIGLRNARLMRDQLTERGYPRERIWVILNRADLPGGISVSDLEERLGVKIRYQIPNDQELATYTINRGVPMALDHRRSPVARACLGLARELAAELAPAGKAGAPARVRPAPPMARQRQPVLKLRWALALALGILGLLVSVLLLLPVVSGKQSSGAAATTTTSQPPSEQAALPGVMTPARGQGEVVATASLPPSPTTAPTATLTQTASPTPTTTPSPMPTASQTLEPSPTPAATAPDTPTPTPTVASPTPRAATPLPPRPSPARPTVSAPVLLAPGPGESRRGIVTFTWQPVGSLPSGSAYEVVWWNAGEDPASARGVAATTTGTSLSADLDALYGAGQLRAGNSFWTVLIVQTAPYVRLTQPALNGPRLLSYAGPSEAKEPPPNPKP